MSKHTDGSPAQAQLTAQNQQAAQASKPPAKHRTFLGQPWGLANLFGVEMWERFSFYGMQSILTLYLYYAVTDGGLGFSPGQAASIVGAYGGFVFLSSIFASLLSDRILGPERTLYYSAILVMFGHIALALLPGVAGLAVGLISVSLGSGGVKTCAQVVLGGLYTHDDPRRDSGFSIFYLGVNIGAFFGPLLTGWAWGMGSFHYGFGLAAIGMAAGLIQYTLMRKDTIGAAGSEVPNPLTPAEGKRWTIIAVATVAVLAVTLLTGIIGADNLSTVMALVALISAVVFLWQMYTSKQTTDIERSRLLGYLPLHIGAVMFFAIFQSQFIVIAIYSDKRLDRSIGNWELGPSQIQAINPLFIILLSGVFATLWTKLGNRQWSTATKFGVANILTGLSLFLFVPYAHSGENGTPLLIMVAVLLIFTLSELLLSPIGNSMATKVAPSAFRSRMFAVWLMSISLGTSLSGTLGDFYDYSDGSAEITFFSVLGITAIVIGLALILLRGWILKKFVDVR
ncbi:MAG: peptide MFS transporter [Corynebacterium sp.]|nr:peptide MFS transporter [Corynebacterium sp.]